MSRAFLLPTYKVKPRKDYYRACCHFGDTDTLPKS